MIGYVTLGTNDLPRASAFYDALLAVLGAKRAMDLGRGILWSTGPNQPMLMICKPYDGQPMSVGNGVMVALAAKDRAQVDALHAKALELGATDEGTPGERMKGFYGGYFRDLDGNKLCAFKMG
jgi:catechol 2,3-dioxygenase-like lactoylglutathione lyase family enzyme